MVPNFTNYTTLGRFVFLVVTMATTTMLTLMADSVILVSYVGNPMSIQSNICFTKLPK